MSFPNLTIESIPPLPPYISMSPSKIRYNGEKFQQYYQQYYTLFYHPTHSFNLNLNLTSTNPTLRYPIPISPSPRIECENDFNPLKTLYLILASVALMLGLSFAMVYFSEVWATRSQRKKGYKEGVEATKKEGDALEESERRREWDMGFESGKNLGRTEGEKECKNEEFVKGREEGFKEGRKRGREEGLSAGRALGLRVVGRNEENGSEEGFELL